MLRKDRAICLRCVDFSETSQVVTFFSENAGKLSAIAKGSRRAKSAFDGAIEVFSFGDILYQPPRSGELSTLTEFQQIPLGRGLRSSFFGLQCGLCAAELVEGLTTSGDANPSLFEAFLQFLTDLQTPSRREDQLALLILFQLKLLQEIGLFPLFQTCSNCGRAYGSHRRNWHYSRQTNGLICPDCEAAFTDKLAISRSATEVLSNLQRLHSQEGPVRLEIEKLLLDHFAGLLHHTPKTAGILLAAFH